jgi:hypothetical protein
MKFDETLSTKNDWQIFESEISKDIILLDLVQIEKIKSQDKIQLYLNDIDAYNLSPLEAAKKCNQFIFENFRYVKGITTVETTVDEILEFRSGVCQDFAHVLLQMLRTNWHSKQVCKWLYLSK